MKPEQEYLFRAFEDVVVDPDDQNDVQAAEIRKIAAANGLTVKFNKVGAGFGGATVMPPANQVTISLFKGVDQKWRVSL